MAQKKKHHHKPLPKGMTYADKLAQDRMLKQAVEQAAKDDMVAIRADIRSQRTLWMSVCANNIAFGHAQERTQQFFAAFEEVADWLDETAKKHGAEYALDKLRQQAEKVSGMKIGYLYEKEMIEARKRNEARGVFFSEIEEEGSR